MTAFPAAELHERAAWLTVGFDGEAWILGRPDLGIFVAVPEPGAVFVTTLQETGSVADAAARAGEVAGEQVDGDEFLEGLAAAGLFEEMAGPDARGRIRWIEGVSPRAAARLFGRVGWSCYAAAVVAVLVILATQPDLRPSWEDAWFLPSPGVSLLAGLLLTIAFTALHEAWHWLAGRAIGVPAVFRLSYRGIYVVFETDLTQIVAVPRNRRHGVYLAGTAIDSVVLAVVLGLRLLDPPDVLDRVLAAVALLQLTRIIWQWAALPLRSDSYALLANALRCHNLYRATWLTTKGRLLRLTPEESDELTAMSARDRRIAGWFAVPYVIGIAIMTWMFFAIALPLVISLGQWAWERLGSAALGSFGFWEALLVAAYAATELLLPVALALRERRLRRTGRLL
ncbi:hypothetical protein [Nonomuraea sp. SYSU D8015]|uniref:hypothetical protein n=1 Tax=Nonomuraea sp. SYSU D8015 TaxID=2593644 RepID=UPI001661819A|nr:hypothetical protein [Nonomuraea sp. SYSU D8015]